MGAILIAGVLVTGAPAVADARVHVFVGGTLGVPLYPYYPYPAYYYGPYYAPYPYYSGYYAAPGVPPPGWEAGRWEWRYDAAGRPIRVWVPGHLH